MLFLQSYLLFVGVATKNKNLDRIYSQQNMGNKQVPPILLKTRFPDQQMLLWFNNLKQDSGNYEGSNQGWVKDYTHWFVIDEVQCESWKCFRKSLQSMKSRFVCSI